MSRALPLFALLLLCFTECQAVKMPVVRPLGLITQPNKYGQYPPGAMSIAKNVILRDPGVLSSLPGLQYLRQNADANGYSAKRLWSGDTYHLMLSLNGSTWSVKWVSQVGATTTVTSPSAFAHAFGTGIAPVARQRGRTILGSTNAPLVLDSENDSSARIGGLGKPFIFSNNVATGTAMLDGHGVRYVARLVRPHSDGYETTGPFSTPHLSTNGSGAARANSVIVYFHSNRHVAAGDMLELYRTRNKTGDPGITYKLVKSVTLTAADITAEFVTIADNVEDSGLGIDAHINPGIDGPTKDHDQPPIARDIVVHNGYTLYLGTTTPARVNEFLGGAWSGDGAAGAILNASERAAGIGTRTFTADRTNGSPVLTNISAADMVGLDIGQEVDSTFRIIALGATSVTLDANETSTDVGILYSARDKIMLDGQEVAADFLRQLHREVERPPLVVSSGNTPHSFWTDKFEDTGVSGDVLLGVSFSIAKQWAYEGSFTLQATNGGNYSPQIPTYSQTAKTVSPDTKLNRVHWSQPELPEAVPLLNTFLVGSGEIYRGVSVGGVVLVFASDGLWMITGDGINGWNRDPVDPTLILASRGAIGVMDELVYAYTNRGLVSITPAGQVTELSSKVIGQAATSGEFAGAGYADTWATYLVCDELHHEVMVTLNSGDSFYVYNTRTKAFTTFVPADDASAAVYSRRFSSLMFATATANGPSLEYFVADSSATRHSGAQVRFQPLVASDPSSTKDWIDVEFAFEGVTAPITLVPSFDASNYTAIVIPANAIESRIIVPVHTDAPAMSQRLAPGFTFSAGDTACAWSLRMMAVTYEIAMEEGLLR